MKILGMLKLFLILVCASKFATASRILFLVPYGAPSHAIFYNALITGLAKSNHFVRIISPVKVMDQDYKNVHESVMVYNKKVEIPNFLDWRIKGRAHHLIFELKSFGYKACDNFLQAKELNDVLSESKKEKYDILLTGSLIYECAMPVAHIMSIPRIVVSSAGILPWLDWSLGNPQQWSYAPNLYLGYSDHMSFGQRFYNTFFSLLAKLQREFIYLPEIEALVRKHLDANIPSLSELDKEVSLALTNTDPSMDYPKSNFPNVISLGGMHINSSQTLPKDLRTFMDESGDAGILVFSMGSVIKERDIPKEIVSQFVQVFKSIPHRVIWKWNSEIPPADSLPANIRLIKWLPQQAILAHPKTKVFVTHGGLGSCTEAVYNAVPIIGLPLFGDQDYNVMRAVQDGSGIFLEFSDLTADSLKDAIIKITKDNRYKESMEKRSRVLKDKFVDPVALGVYYIEYVIRHKGASHLRPATHDLSWYQVYLIDVFIVALILLSLLCKAAIKLLIAIYHISMNNLTKPKVNKKKTK